MKEILLVNPRRRRKKTTKKKKPTRKKIPARRRKTNPCGTTRRKGRVSTMAKRRRRKAAKARIVYRSAPKRRYRRNPSTRRRRVRRYAKRAGSRMTSGMSVKRALKNVAMMQIGMFAAKAAALIKTDATEINPVGWDWRAYVQGGLGGAAAALAVNAIKPGTGQRILEGSLAYLGFKLIENELVQKNATAMKYLGADDDEEMVLDLEGTPYMNSYGQALPLDESHRMQLPEADMSDAIVPVNRLGFADSNVPVGPLGDDRVDAMRRFAKAYRY